MKFNTQLLLVLRLIMSGAVALCHMYAFMVWTDTILPFILSLKCNMRHLVTVNCVFDVSPVM